MISGDAAGAVGEGEAGAFSCHSGGEGGGEIGALSNGLDSGIPQRLTANTAEHGIGWSENIFEGGGVLEIDPGKLRIGFTYSGEFHDRMIRSSDDHDLIAHERRNAVSDPDRRGSDQGEVKKTFQELVLEVNAVHLTDLNMDFWIEGAEAL